MSTTFETDADVLHKYRTTNDIEMNDLSHSHYDNARKSGNCERCRSYCIDTCKSGQCERCRGYCIVLAIVLTLIAVLVGGGLLIYFGYDTLENAKTYVYPAIETECIITHRGSDSCKLPGETEKNRGVMYVNCILHCVSVSRVTNINIFSNKLQFPSLSLIRYDYYAYVSNCSETEMFRSSEEKCQHDAWLAKDPKKVNIGDTTTCYIDDCSTMEFVLPFDSWEWNTPKKTLAWFIIVIGFLSIACCWVALKSLCGWCIACCSE